MTAQERCTLGAKKRGNSNVMKFMNSLPEFHNFPRNSLPDEMSDINPHLLLQTTGSHEGFHEFQIIS